MTSGNRPAPEQGSWQVPGAASAYQQPDEATSRGLGRPVVVALVVALVELAIIAAGCNQSVAKHAARYAADHSDSFLGNAVRSSFEFTWRLRPLSGDNHAGRHIYAAQLVRIGVLVVLSGLLAAVVVRGTVTFWRAFFGVWTGVLAAACVARAVGALVTTSTIPGTDRATSAVFHLVTGSTVFAGTVLGLLAALVAALVARATRRAVERPPAAAPGPEPAYAAPEPPPPFYGNPPQPAYGNSPQPFHGDAPQPSHGDSRPQPGGYPEADGRTTQLPRVDRSGTQQWSTPEVGDGQATQAMPTDPSDPGDERR